jgi:hypothetical protein
LALSPVAQFTKCNVPVYVNHKAHDYILVTVLIAL